MIKIINVELAQIYRRLRLVNVEVMRQILLELEDEPTRLDLLLLEKNLVTEDQNCRVYEKYFGIKSLDIDKVQTNPQAVKMVTQEFVIKNNILRRAATEAGYEGIQEYFVGPSAVAFSKKEATSAPKIIFDFAKKNQAVKVKAGVVEGKFMDAKEMKVFATLPNKEGMVAMLLSVLQAPIRNLGCVIKAVAEKEA